MDTNPFQSRPAIIHRDREFELGGQPVIDIKGDTACFMRQPLAEVLVIFEVAKNPTTTVEVDVDGTRWLIVLGRRPERADSDVAPLDGALLLGDDKIAGVHNLPAVCNGVPLRVPAEVFDWHLMRGYPAGIVPIVVLQEDGIEPRGKLRWDAVESGLLHDDSGV